MIPPSTAEEPAGRVEAVVRECPGCGLFQIEPALSAGMTARCERCGTTLRRTRQHSLEHSLALALAALILLIVMCLSILMTVRTSGIVHDAGMFSGPAELVRRGMSGLAAVVVFVTVVAPLGKLIGTIYVLLRIREATPPRHLRRVFVWVERLSTWSMVEVFVLGVFVAYVKLGDLVTIELNTGVYALLALTFVFVWADSVLDREAVWDALGGMRARDASREALLAGRVPPRAVGCEICTLVVVPEQHGAACPRCGSALHARKLESIAWTWALVIAAAVTYLPANLYPVLTVVQLGAGQPSTILGGVRELIQSRMYPLAALVFFASIAVPMLKMVGLTAMLISVQTGHTRWLRDRTRLYYIIHWIGRWSMIDIFMEALLGALVQFGGVVTIEPGIGAVAFCAVVVLTIFAAETFDPRIMWDAAEGGMNSKRIRAEA
ncbi:MAG: paraquat-inducible protein [Acetobacteraceae bacterium]|jgi:paraquat-inducible protein A|nr:paraquat-inducible protein [Acetobacteraceae bacterium]